MVVDAIDANLLEEIVGVLRIDLEPEHQVSQDENGLIYCTLNPKRDPRRLRKEIMSILARCCYADHVASVWIEHWDDRKQRYVSTDPAAAAAGHSRVRIPLTDVRWVVRVTPSDVFHWRRVREELARRGRPVIGEHQNDLDVPAADEEDALQLVADLQHVKGIRSATARRLNWFERWWRREELFGNYASDGGGGFG